jgi:biopolymer transport protein ExbB/TolQ
MSGDGTNQALSVLSDAEARNRFWELPDRRTMMPLSLGAAVVAIVVLTIILPTTGAYTRAAQILLDRPSMHFVYPFTIQNLMHLLFFLGLGELFVRWRIAQRELGFLARHFLPEDEATVLQVQDLGPLRRRVAREFTGEHGFLPSLIDLSILQFQSGRSIDQTVSVMNSSLELIEHRVDLRYGLIRYIAWLVPTLGFIGTVIGLGASLAEAGASKGDVPLQTVAATLAVGFDCTMVALVQSAILVFLLQLVQEKEETSVNLAGGYCLRNLINRLYVGAPTA